MSRLILVITSLMLIQGTRGQDEFPVHSNGFMYSDSTMAQLTRIVDSLNIKHRSCDLHKTYFATSQSRCHFIYLEKGDLEQAAKDLAAQISFDEFIRKHRNVEYEKDLVVIRSRDQGYNDKDQVSFESYLPERTIVIDEQVEELYSDHLARQWIVEINEKTEYSEASIRAFYVTDRFDTPRIPIAYARQIQYADCLVDTTTQIFLSNADRSVLRYEERADGKIKKFLDHVHAISNMPSGDGDRENYWKAMERWRKERFSVLDSAFAARTEFKELLNDAVDEALRSGGSTDEFEVYVGRYHSRAAELELKRGRIVVGGCSMDDSPRIHAMQIALLSAETINWEVFLRAHLNIMNDRFDRMSDGSYAWQGRKTYLRELEVLQINTLDLLIGISLQIENPSENHYFGSIRRIGRALTEADDLDEAERRMFAMITDPELDDHNRIVGYFLFLNYHHHLEDEGRKKLNRRRLREAVAALPPYLAKRMSVE